MLPALDLAGVSQAGRRQAQGLARAMSLLVARVALKSRMSTVAEPGMLGGTVGAVVPFAGMAARPLASYFEKARAAKNAGVQKRAIDPIQEALEEGTLDVEGAVKAPQPGSKVVDQYPATRALARSQFEKLGTKANPDRNEIVRRAESVVDDLPRSLDDKLGLPEGPDQVFTRLRAETKVARDTAYKQAWSNNINYASPEWKQTMMALDRAWKMEPGVFREAKKLIAGDKFKRNPDFFLQGKTMTRPPNLQEVDAIARALQDKAKVQRGKVKEAGGTTQKGGSYEAMVSDIRAPLKESIPDYANALSVAAPPKIAQDAVKLGDAALKTSMRRDTLLAEVAVMKRKAPQHADMIDEYLLKGMRNYIDETMERAKTSVSPELTATGRVSYAARRHPATLRLLKDLSSDVSRSKIETLVGKEKAAALFRDLDEAQLAITTHDELLMPVQDLVDKSVAANAKNLEETRPTPL